MRISDWSSDVCSSDLDRVVTRRRYAVATLLTGALFSVLFAVVAFRAPRPRFTWNASASAPIGLYRLTPMRSEEHTSELQSLMRISYAVFCLKKKIRKINPIHTSKYRTSIQHSRTMRIVHKY